MRLVLIDHVNQPNIAVESEHDLVLLGDSSGLPRSMIELIKNWDSLKERVAEVVANGTQVPKSEAKLLAPVDCPSKIICIGKNYTKHAEEMGSAPPSIPVVFSKFNSAIAAPNSNVVLPAISQKVDFEAELVVVIGKRGRFIDRADAMSHVFGYCCGNDISARDWQKEKPGGQWLLGKTFDTFAPLGPCIVTADELSDPHNLEISLTLNGRTMQSSNTRNLIFPIDFLVAHLSQFMTLEPGDLIFTGTPDGVGAARKPPVFLKNGDHMEVTIESVGTLTNQVAGC